jgi:glycosyltransferase involved in cell wall biosynthesis
VELSINQIVVLAIAGFFLLSLTIYYLYFFTSLKKGIVQTKAESKLPVSIIIAARNERKNLEKNLPAILNQKYPDFEVIVVNDGSHDGTKDLLKEWNEKYDKLKVVTLEIDERFQKGKKFALTMGIKAASHEHLLFTDADCIPASENWISGIASNFGSKEIVLGVSPLNARKSILGSIINYETFHTSLQYLTYSIKGNTYMGVGRNLAYTKDLFFKNKGFASHQHIMSGDDDLFVQEASSKTNTAVCLESDTFMVSEAPASFKAWIHQKLRHLSTGKEYQSKFKRMLGFYSFAHIMVYLCAIVFMILHPETWYIGLGILGVKWLIQWVAILSPSKILKSPKVGYILPYYDILYTLFLLFFGIASIFIKPKTWS